MIGLVLALAAPGGLQAQAPGWPTTSPEVRWQGSDAWRESDFAVLASEHSPAVLISSKQSTLRLFANLNKWGLGAPRVLYLRDDKGVRVRTPDESISIAGESMQSPWVILSFVGAAGWGKWDSPWLVVLQHRPTALTLSDEGLDLQFPDQAGLVAAVPASGSYKSLHQGWRDSIADSQTQVSRGIAAAYGDLFLRDPWTLLEPRSFPTRLSEQCDRWAAVLRHWPLNCREEIRVLPGQDVLRVRGTYEYVDIEDDWGTKGAKVAPLPPTLALAINTGFPAKVQQPYAEDIDVPTAYGPYRALAGDTYTIDFPVQHLNEKEVQQPPNLDDPIVALAAQHVSERMAQKFHNGDLDRIWDHGDGGNYCWQVMGDRYYAKALAYAPEEARQNARRCMAAYVREWLLNEGRYKPFQGKLILEGPGIGNWGGYDDSGKFSANTLETLYWYAQYTGDWDVIRDRWDTCGKLFVTPRECRWRGFGRDSIAEMGVEPQPPLAMARMAYAIGDMDTYAYAAYIYVRELVHTWVKTVPGCAEWFRGTQPWEGGEEMDGPIWLTNLWGDVAGWRIDGPDYPNETGERQYRNRWVRFGNEDVARFMREEIGEEVLRKELDWWLARDDSPYKPGSSTAHIAPSMEQLRSLLLNESPDELAKLAPMQEANIGRHADAISYYLSFIRTGRPVQLERVVPKDLPDSPWMLGLEREADGTGGDLVVGVWGGDDAWPTIVEWRAWQPPKEAQGLPGGKRWSYGQIIPGDGAAQPKMEWERLSWTCVARRSQ